MVRYLGWILTTIAWFGSVPHGFASAALDVTSHARSGPLLADGKRLTGLGRLPAATVVIVNGHPTTAGALRIRLRSAALAHLGPQKTYLEGKLPLAFHDDVGSLPGETAATRPPSSRVTPDPTFCTNHAPVVSHASGSVTPGGYLVVEGLCLGSQGTIRLAGTFPGPWLDLAVQHWDDGSITASLPSVSGVYDQTVRVEIITGRRVSNLVPVAFTAAREIVQLPAHFITNVACSQGVNQGDNATTSCEAAAALHWQEDTGTDDWQAVLPQGWVLTSLGLSTGFGSILGTEGFDRPSPSVETWTVSWQSGIAGTENEDTGPFFLSFNTVDLTCASYAMTLYAQGPVGTMPP